jgi:hypothetical protein
MSLKQRYPTIFPDDRLAQFLVCQHGETPISALAVHPFEWQQETSTFQGAMLGLVATHPAWRGRGCASLLLQYARTQLTDAAIDFAVLWTAQTSFYVRHGWLERKGGVLGSFRSGACTSTAPVDAVVTPLNTCEPQFFELVREKYCASYLTRPRLHYATVPLPAEEVVAITASLGDQQAYALIGVAGETAYVYEMHGESSLFARIWTTACQRWRTFVINDHESSASYAWFKSHVAVQWQPKALAMWLPLSNRASRLQRADWHLPYFDRI